MISASDSCTDDYNIVINDLFISKKQFINLFRYDSMRRTKITFILEAIL